MNYQETEKRISAAQALLLESTTTREKFKALKSLIFGIHPGLDTALERVDQGIATVENIIGGEVIHLTTQHLPEQTEEERKRKRALLLFITTWKDLKSEVARVGQELQATEHTGVSGEKATHVGRIFRYMKGPLGITTIVAVGAVLLLQSTSVTISLHNQGCGMMQVSASIPIHLPGLSLPNDPIPNGGSAVVTIPPLTVDVDGTMPGVLTLHTFNFTMTFELPNNISEVTMNGVSLLGTKSRVRLLDEKEHSLILVCA